MRHWLPFLGLLALTVAGEDFTVLDRRTFRGATARRLDEDRLVIEHSGGRSTLFFHEVPEALRLRLGYDTESALRRLTLEVFRLRGRQVDGATERSPGPGSDAIRPKLLEPIAIQAQTASQGARAERWAGLETPDPAVRPVCEWLIDDKIPAFHTRRDGRTLVAENNRSRWKLLEAGQTVTFEVCCDGLEDGLVELRQARLQP